MRKIIILTVLFISIFGGPSSNAQIKYAGSLNMYKKYKSFFLTSELDTFHVLIDKRDLDFINTEDFSFIKTKKKNYQLFYKHYTIIIVEKNNQVYYSTDASFYVEKKRSRQLVLKDQTGKVVLDANFFLKKGITDFNLTISDTKYKTGLLAYATYYLYNQSKILKASYDTPYISFGF